MTKEILETYEEYEKARDELLAKIPADKRAQREKLYKQLKVREQIKIAEMRKPKTDFRDLAIKEYHKVYDRIIVLEHQIGLLPIAKQFAKAQAKKFGDMII